MAGEALADFILLFFVLFWLLLIVVAILGTVFWIFMLVDAAKREFPKKDEKAVWIIVVALTGMIGALIYYFIVKRKNVTVKSRKK